MLKEKYKNKLNGDVHIARKEIQTNTLNCASITNG